jgi:hypothetical protein
VDALGLGAAEAPGKHSAPAIAEGEQAPSQQEWAEHHRQMRAEAIEIHRADARDPEWVRTMETALGGDLANVGSKPEAGFEFVSVECKTT